MSDEEQARAELEARAEKLFSGPVTFLKSAPALKFLPDADAPEVALCGRSNVGKSSLLNAITAPTTLPSRRNSRPLGVVSSELSVSGVTP